MYRRIVLAYDGTEEGRRALREGALVAHRCRAEVFLLAIDVEPASIRMADSIHPEALAQYQEKTKAIFQEGVERLRGLGFKVTARFASGDPADHIPAFAREVRADLVVVGYRKLGRLERWWSGPKGAYLSDNLTCSLLVSRTAIDDANFQAELQGELVGG
jgi:nucleotide-binding universal stress UspA family protein